MVESIGKGSGSEAEIQISDHGRKKNLGFMTGRVVKRLELWLRPVLGVLVSKCLLDPDS